jgi:hypothetical protein
VAARQAAAARERRAGVRSAVHARPGRAGAAGRTHAPAHRHRCSASDRGRVGGRRRAAGQHQLLLRRAAQRRRAVVEELGRHRLARADRALQQDELSRVEAARREAFYGSQAQPRDSSRAARDPRRPRRRRADRRHAAAPLLLGLCWRVPAPGRVRQALPQGRARVSDRSQARSRGRASRALLRLLLQPRVRGRGRRQSRDARASAQAPGRARASLRSFAACGRLRSGGGRRGGRGFRRARRIVLDAGAADSLRGAADASQASQAAHVLAQGRSQQGRDHPGLASNASGLGYRDRSPANRARAAASLRYAPALSHRDRRRSAARHHRAVQRAHRLALGRQPPARLEDPGPARQARADVPALVRARQGPAHRHRSVRRFL